MTTRRNFLATITAGAAALPVAGATGGRASAAAMGPNDAELWRLAREHTRLEDERDSFAEEDGATERERDRLWQRKLAIAKRQEAIQARMTAIPPDSIAGVRALARVLRRQAYCPGADVLQWRMAAEHIDAATAQALVDGLLKHGGPA